MRKQIYIGLLVLLLHSVAWAQPAKTVQLVIEGQVIDSEGSPVAGAMVQASPDALRGRVPMAPTDGQGKFTVVVHQTGMFVVSAAKPSAGYPSSFNPFYDPAGEATAQALVEENRPAPFVTVRLGRKAGTLVATTVDANTGRPIEDLEIRLCRAEVPKYCLRISKKNRNGQFDVEVPVVPFTIQISAPGYQDWFGTDGVNQQERVQVASDTVRGLDVSLKKLSARDASVLPAPDQLSPLNGTEFPEFSHNPRQTSLEWSVVAGAVSYSVELDFCQPGGPDHKECQDPRPYEARWNQPMTQIDRTSYDFKFLGTQPGRWRVWALDREGRAGAKSAWSYFIYIP